MSRGNTVFEMLEYKLEKASISDQKWVLYVRDHRQNLLKSAKLIYLNDDLRERYRYRLDMFLGDGLVFHQRYHWVVAEVNGLCGSIEFDNLPVLYVPSQEAIEDLYRQYLATEANDTDRE